MRIGVLALQGGFRAHADTLRRLGLHPVHVRHCVDLCDLDGLILPGGESTTLLHLMEGEPWFDTLREFHGRGGALFGTCAGAILLSREVRGPAQPSVGLLDAVVRRNAFGRQRESFEARLEWPESRRPVRGVFIRAPRFESLGPEVEVLCRFEGEPVLVRHAGVLAGTFHPELTGDGRLHRYFARMTAESRKAAAAGRGAAGARLFESTG